MPAQELLDYVKEQLERGARAEDIKQVLLNQGWNPADVQQAMNQSTSPLPPTMPSAPSVSETPTDSMSSVNTMSKLNNPPTSFSQVSTTPSSSKAKPFIKILVVLILLLGIFGGAAGYWWYAKADQFLIKRAVTQMSKIDSVQYDGYIKINAEIKDPALLSYDPMSATQQVLGLSTQMKDSENAQQLAQLNMPAREAELPNTVFPSIPSESDIPRKFGVSMNFNGAAEGQEWRTAKSQASVEIALKGFDALIPDLESLMIDFKFIDKKIYFRIGGLKLIGQTLGLDLSSVEDQWIKIDPQDLNQYDSYFHNSDFEKEMDKQMDKYQAIKQKLPELISQYKIINITKKSLGEKIDGVSTIKADFTINKDLLDDFTIEYLKQAYQDDEFYNMTNQEWKEVQKSLAEGLKQIPEIKGTVWVGMTDQNVRRVQVDIPNIGEADKYQVDFSYQMNYSKINQPQDISVPDDAQDLQQTIENMQSALENSYTSPVTGINPGLQFARARDSQRRSDIYAVLNGSYQYAVENSGKFPDSITTTPTDIGTSGLNLAQYLVPTYMASIPYDPSGGTPEITGYLVFLDSSGRITATARGEAEPMITVTR